MDKKDLEAIAKIVHSEIESSNNVLREEMNQSNQSLREEVNQSIQNLREEMNQLNQSLREEILDRMFNFEQEYGKKIDMIYDIAVAQKDKVKELYKEQEIFRNRAEDLDTQYFNLEHRVFKLEHKD